MPLSIGHIRTQTHDYVRHGTLTLFAAMDYLQGRLISSIETQHRHQEWLAFLKKINRETPKTLQLHLIVDNYATHTHPVVKEWLKRHPRFPYVLPPDLKLLDERCAALKTLQWNWPVHVWN
jgi:hypothetical protein